MGKRVETTRTDISAVKARFGQELLNFLPLPVFYEDTEGCYIWCNEAFCEFMGRGLEEIVSKKVFEINPTPGVKVYLENDLQMMKSRSALEIRERLMRRGDGEVRNVLTYKSLQTKSGEVNGIIGALLDITELRKAQASEEFYREKLVALASAFSVSKEQERCRIAQEIHDSISQNLAYSKLKLQFLSERLEEENLSDLRNDLAGVIAIIGEALERTRTLMFEMGVPVLYQLGLEAALQWLVGEMSRKYGFVVRFTATCIPEELSDDQKAFLFRSAQELLTNVVKHAGVNEASLSVRKRAGHVTVRVRDKGKGFDVSELDKSDLSNKSYGLFSLETLVRSLGGDVRISSVVGRGTDVTLRIPIAPKKGRTSEEGEGIEDTSRRGS